MIRFFVYMRVLFGSLIVLILLPAMAQKKRAYNEKNDEWIAGTVYFSDRTIAEKEFRLVISFNEGSLQIREGEDKFSSYSPNQVYKFVFFDSTYKHEREFISIRTGFSDRPGSKLVFQELLFEGKEYSLFKRYLSQPRSIAVILIAGPAMPALAGRINYAKGRPSLFVHKKDDKAYQVTKGEPKSYYAIGEKPRVRYKLDKRRLKLLLDDQYKAMKKYAKANNLKLKKEDDFEEATKFLDNSAFAYNRKETPRKFRK